MRARLSRLGIIVVSTFGAMAGSGVASSATIEAELSEQLDAGYTSDFVVRFAEQADLSAAYGMGWQERGEFVYARLREVAERSQSAARAVLGARGVSYQSFLAANEIYVRTGDAELARALSALAGVEAIRAPRVLRTSELYDPPPIGETEFPALAWGVADARAPELWSLFGTQGEGIVVAEMTTGVQWDHPALVGAYHCGSNPSDPACWNDPSNVCGGSMCDNNGHGTLLTGIMVGSDDPALTWQAGMAPGAEWIACKGCESSSCSEFALNSCADWLMAPAGNPNDRPHVVLVGWGGGGCDNWFEPKIAAWRAAGIFPAAMAGNNGACGQLSSPGDYQVSFAAAAHDVARVIAPFSGRGPSCFGHDPFTKPNLSAPGVSICSSVPGSGWSCASSGTGPAAAHIAGAVALLWSCAPALVGQIDSSFMALQDGAAVPPAGNCGAPPDGEGNYTYGYGFLDIVAAATPHCSSLPFADGFESGDTSAWSATVP